MSGKVFQKRAIDRNGGLDRKRELPPIEQPKRLTAPLVFGRGRAICSKGSGDLRVSAEVRPNTGWLCTYATKRMLLKNSLPSSTSRIRDG
jgi:hypothetical protein